MNLRIFVDFSLPPAALELLRRGTASHDLIFSSEPAASVLSPTKNDPLFLTADIAFGQPDPLLIKNAGQLRWVHISTSSITRYDNPKFRNLMQNRNIVVTNSAHVYFEACATHLLSFMLAQARNLPIALGIRALGGNHLWESVRENCEPLSGQTVVITGFGAIGKRLTQLLQPFEMKISAFRRTQRGDEGVPVISESQLDDALALADHVVNILPDSSMTRDFFSDARIKRIKPGAIFYNIGRGATVDHLALFDALKSRRIKAAWLDVTDPEPLPDDHPLASQPNCFITPHVAGGSNDEGIRLVNHFLGNLKRFIDGESLLDRVM